MCVPQITRYSSTVISILSCLAQPDPNALLLSSIFSATWQQLSRTLGLIPISSFVPFGTFLFRAYETYGAIILIAIESSHLQVNSTLPAPQAEALACQACSQIALERANTWARLAPL